MKKLLLLLLLVIAYNQKDIQAQCPPGAFAYQSLYPQCPSGCGVLLLGWPEGVVVNIYGGTPLTIITSALISGTLGNGGTGDAFTCVPCNTPLVYASTILGASGGCVIATIGIVPVKVTSFSAISLAGNTVRINWSTSLETGPVKYVVQKSNNGRDFTDMVTLDGTQLPLINNYTYSAPVAPGSSYFRIKIIEVTGNILYSETALVKNATTFGFSVYPNPAANEFKITLPAKFLPAVVNIIDAQGKILYTEKITETTSAFTKSLPKGVYAVKVTGNDYTTVTQRLIKN